MSCHPHICIAKFLLRILNALSYLEENAADVFGVTHIQDGVLQTASWEETVFLMAAHRYVTDPSQTKEKFWL